jgi:hypothetical protein
MVLGDLNGLAALERYGDELARLVVGHRDTPRAGRLHHHERHASFAPVPALGHLPRGQLRPRVGPQQDVMGEVDLVTLGERHLGHRHVRPGDLALRLAELDAARSRIGGCSTHPSSSRSSRVLTGAPQFGQAGLLASELSRQ